MAVASPELGMLRWRCRRGMKELDVLLERYVDQSYHGAPAAEQASFRQLLDTEDPELHAYCLGRLTPPARFAALIERITANEGLAASAVCRR